MQDNKKNFFTLRSIIIGTILSVIISIGDIYNMIVIKGSYMTLDLTTPAALFFIFWITLLNLLLRKVMPKASLSAGEMILIYIMMIVASSIPTMGFTLYFIPLISGLKYHTTPQNKWDTLILPHIKKHLILQDENAIKWFYEGLPYGEKIPWIAWFKPIFFWFILILSVYLVMIFLMVLVRKQWVENERITYPLTNVPIELINAHQNNILINRLFWIGFMIPFLIGCINGLHFYFPAFPSISLVNSIPIFRRTVWLILRISFPMMGFTYFVNLPLAFSLWFFCLLTNVETGIMNITGLANLEWLPYTPNAILGWQSFGGLIVLVLYGLWISRKYFLNVVRNSFNRKDREDEIVSYKVALLGTLICLLFIFIWMVISGLKPLPAIVTIFFMFILFIGITRVVIEGGLAATRAPVIAPVATTCIFGSSFLGPSGMVALGYMFAYAADIRTFVMASTANALKMLEGIKENKNIIFWAILISIIVTLISSIWATIFWGYKYGAINADTWFFISGPQYPWKYAAEQLMHPTGTRWGYIGIMFIGAAITGIIQFMRMRLFWFPFHPLGFVFSTIMMTNQLWFSIFLAWMIKRMILKYGGDKAYKKGKNFFIGLVIGQFVVNGLWLIIDFITGHSGNVLFWA
ncbi:MAG: hypothetical protein NC905_05110 [Candidatus Omnitrophica bacterium]|nr:hypothetical protein [Candidatus Omnitrophota bacterium]